MYLIIIILLLLSSISSGFFGRKIGVSLSITIFWFVGIPLVIGFFAKQMDFRAVLDYGCVFIALVAILTSVFAAGYCLNLIKQIYFFKPDYVKNPSLFSSHGEKTFFKSSLVCLVYIIPTLLLVSLFYYITGERAGFELFGTAYAQDPEPLFAGLTRQDLVSFRRAFLLAEIKLKVSSPVGRSVSFGNIMAARCDEYPLTAQHTHTFHTLLSSWDKYTVTTLNGFYGSEAFRKGENGVVHSSELLDYINDVTDVAAGVL